MNYYIDTHAHLYDDDFKSERKEIIARAIENGVNKIILPGIDKSYHDSLLTFSAEFPGIAFPAAGLHPTSVKKDWKKEVDFVAGELSKEIFCAVGEIGIDGYWSKEFLIEQKDAFAAQIELASKYNLPVIIHSREATEEIFNVLEYCKKFNISGVFHAFSGSWETYKRLMSYGNFKIGIGGVITYKNSHLPDVIKRVDLNDIILETDAPWLTPVPFRGKRNEPSFIPFIAQTIASVKDCPVEEVANITTENAQKLFKI